MNILLVSQSYCEETKFIWVRNSEIFIHMPLSYSLLALTIKMLILHIYSKKAEITGLPKVLSCLPCYLLFLKQLPKITVSILKPTPVLHIHIYTHVCVHAHTRKSKESWGQYLHLDI